MDLSYTPEEEAFRARVRAWIEANQPTSARRDPEVLRDWQRRLFGAGYLGAAWPREWGGAGLAPMQQAILNEELARANAPSPLGHMGLSWVGPAILGYGSDAQKRRFIEPLLRGDDVWATGYSEPGAGSDMFNTQTRAEREGDAWVVNGQKTWTSQATECNWLFLLVRTSSEGQKWAGLSVLLVPLATPGIEIRPIRQINGESHFCEVFLRDARVPSDALLGREGQGYEIVSSALINERTGIASAIRYDHAFAKIVETARQRGLTDDPVWRQRIADLAIKARIMKAMSLSVLSDQLHDRFNPHTSAAMKCIASTFTQQFSEAGVEMLGPFGVLLEGDPEAPGHSVWPERFLGDRAMTIAGGTSEIQRNIVAERVLGLPRR
jgi:alkylation response protein AidB-like acyl-CoA dehydrogenase